MRPDLIIASVVVGVITPTIPTVESKTTSESTTAETSEAPTESAETTKSTAAEGAKPAAAEAAAKPTAPETSSAEPPMKTATVKSPAAPGNRLVVGHHQDSGKQRDSTNRPRFPHFTLQLQRRISPKLLLMHT
jgi:septal ring-binding cell division protein DamX